MPQTHHENGPTFSEPLKLRRWAVVSSEDGISSRCPSIVNTRDQSWFSRLLQVSHACASLYGSRMGHTAVGMDAAADWLCVHRVRQHVEVRRRDVGTMPSPTRSSAASSRTGSRSRSTRIASWRSPTLPTTSTASTIALDATVTLGGVSPEQFEAAQKRRDESPLNPGNSTGPASPSNVTLGLT